MAEEQWPLEQQGPLMPDSFVYILQDGTSVSPLQVTGFNHNNREITYRQGFNVKTGIFSHVHSDDQQLMSLLSRAAED